MGLGPTVVSALAATLALTLSACGQKGPLYLDVSAPTATTPTGTEGARPTGP
jgi:predicted small lipoprotein YifL